MNTEPEAPAAYRSRIPHDGPVMNRHRLGAELKHLRESRSLRLEDVATRLGVAPSTISRIETGKAPTRTGYLTIMLDTYGITDPQHRQQLTELAREGHRKEWWTPHHELLPPGASTYLGLEAAASEIRIFSVLALPGLLQTADYAAAALRASRPGLSAQEISELVTIQLRRQEQLHRDGQTLYQVIDESVLFRTIGSASVMAEQLDHLHAATSNPAVTIQVSTLAAARSALSLPFTLLSFPGLTDPDIACQVANGGQVTISKRAADVIATQQAFSTLASSALPPANSADLIKTTQRW
jgi:transcriptional regulator with XRE-family HTH domain